MDGFIILRGGESKVQGSFGRCIEVLMGIGVRNKGICFVLLIVLVMWRGVKTTLLLLCGR